MSEFSDKLGFLRQPPEPPRAKNDKPTEKPKKDYHWVRNARFGGWTQERIDTPWSCSVASEAYWCS